MKLRLAGLATLLWTSVCLGQDARAPDPYKSTLDRLESLTVQPAPEWKYHVDMPHPEDPSLNDADWPTVKARETWKTGSRVLRRWVEIPEKINGYATLGASVKLELFINS